MPHELIALDIDGHVTVTEQLMEIAAAEPLWLRQPESIPHAVNRLEGPSTLTLAIIGAATLIAYRSIHDRLVGGKAIAGRVQPQRKGSKRKGRAA